jgi:hypothetical protein
VLTAFQTRAVVDARETDTGCTHAIRPLLSMILART